MPGTAISNLIVKLGADTSSFFKEINNASKGIEKAIKPMETVGKNLTMRVTLPILAVGAAFGAIVVTAARAADEIETMSDKTGLSMKSLQEIKYVASQTNVEFGSLTNASLQLNKNLVAGTDGTKRYADIIKELGLDTQDSTGKMLSMDALFPQVISKLAAMEDPARRDAIAMQLFGKSGQEIIPMLNKGSAEIARLTAEAHKYGLVMGDEAITALAKFNDQMGGVKLQVNAVWAQIATKFMPILQDKLIPFVQDSVIPTMGKVADFIGGVVDAFISLPKPVQAVIGGLLGVVVGIGPVLQGAAQLEKIWGTITTVGTGLAVKLGLIGVEGTVAAVGTTAAGVAAGVAIAPVTGLGVAGHAAAAGITAMGTASSLAIPQVTLLWKTLGLLSSGLNLLLGPWGFVIAGVAGFMFLASKLSGYVEDSTAKMSRLEREAWTLAGTLDGDLSPAVGQATAATDSAATSAAFLGTSLGRLGDDTAEFARKIAIPPVLTLAEHLAALELEVSGLNIDLDISQTRFDILALGLDGVNDKSALLTATLNFEKEQLGLVNERIGLLSDAYQHLLETKGADNEETKKAHLLYLQEIKDRDDITKSIEDTNAALERQAWIKAGMPWRAEGRLGTKTEVKEWAIGKLFETMKVGVDEYGNPVYNVDTSRLDKLTGMAGGGTTINAGMYDVGEHGIEHVFLPAGTTVVPLSQGGNAASRAMGAPAESNVYNVTMQVRADDIRSLANLIDLFKQLPQVARAMGG